MKPARPRAPIAVSAVILVVWWLVAHSSGSGWVQALGDAAFGILIAGILGPAVALSRIRLRLVQPPTDGTATMPMLLKMAASGRVRVRPVDPPGPEAVIGPSGDVTLLPLKRGVHERLVIEVSTAAPFGLQWWSRRMTVPMAAPLHVAPRRGEPVPIPIDAGVGDASRPVKSPAGESHGVRPYEPGDQRRRVHWPSTAHAGRLMVREMEEPSARPLTLRVNLPADPEAAEQVAERAMGTAIELLDRGASLVLATDEPAGAVVSVVADRCQAGRRLARAVPSARSSQLEVRR